MEDFRDDTARVEQNKPAFERAKPGKGRRIINRIFYGVALVAALFAVIAFFSVSGRADSAPQQAAGYAEAIGMAAIPYVLARSFDLMTR